MEEGEGGFGSFGISGLHEDVGHTGARPVGFQEDGKVGVVTGKAGVTDDSLFQVKKSSIHSGCPRSRWDGIALKLATEFAEAGGADSVLWDIRGIESSETDKRVEKRAGTWNRPIAYKVKLGLSGTVAVLSEVVTNPFKTGHVEITFAKVEGQAVADVSFTNTCKEVKEKDGIVGPHEAVVNDLLAVDIVGAVGETGTKETVGDQNYLGPLSFLLAEAQRYHTWC